MRMEQFYNSILLYPIFPKCR